MRTRTFIAPPSHQGANTTAACCESQEHRYKGRVLPHASYICLACPASLSYNTPPCEAPMSIRFTIASVLSLVCLATPSWADFQAGMNAADRGDYATALLEWRPLAEQGHASAQHNLGVLYAKGQGVPQDYATARQWWEKAALQGHANSQVDLGVMYLNGQGVPQDYAIARQWFEKAAAQGDAEAQVEIGVLYHNGQGVPQDYAIARQWFEKAAVQEDLDAQYNLGVLYHNGLGVPQDNVRAYMWWSLAAARSTGDSQKLAAENRDKAAIRMTPAQLAEGQRLATECQAQQFKGC
jgi:uncharacterized protein